MRTELGNNGRLCLNMVVGIGFLEVENPQAREIENIDGHKRSRVPFLFLPVGTVVVKVERRVQHPIYGKTVRQFRKFHAHDEKNETGVGDAVTILETRPMSRLKRWRIAAISRKAGQ